MEMEFFIVDGEAVWTDFFILFYFFLSSDLLRFDVTHKNFERDNDYE
jgi:hypothetical protein